MSYIEKAKGAYVTDLKDDYEFQKDLVHFLSSSRKDYTIPQLKELGVDGMIDEYIEHMRSQDVNEMTAIMDLNFARDESVDERKRLAFGNLMATWDNVEGGGTGKVKGTLDYLEGIVTSPTTAASVFTGGFSKVGALASIKATQAGARAAVKKIMSKQFAKEAAKGAIKPAIVEAGMGAAQIEMQEAAREATIEGYEGMSASEKAIAIGLQGSVGGTIGGIAKAYDVKQTTNVMDALEAQNIAIAKSKSATAKKALTKVATVGRANSKKIDKLLNRIGGLTEVLAKRQASITKKPLDPTKVLEGDKLRDAILKEGADVNISGGLSRHTLQSIFGAALELTEKLEIEPDQRISSALAEALQTNKINTSEVTDIISDYGLSREEFGYIFLSDLSEAGRTLGAAGQVSREIRDSIFKNIEQLSDKGVSLYNDRFAKEVAAEIDFEKGYGETLVDFLKASDSLRIAFMTAQIGTTAANAMFSTARIGIDVTDEIFRQTLRTGYSAVTGQGVPLSNFHAVTSALRGISLNRNEAKLVRDMYARDFPEEYQKIFRDINRAEVSVGVDSTAGKVGAFVNTFNSAVDTRFKQMAFYASLDRQLIEKGTSLKQWLGNNNTLINLPEEIREKAVYDSLDFVFQKGYSSKDGLAGKAASGLIKLHKEAPFVVSGFLGIPFPRYVANHIEFINDYTPIGLVTGGIKGFDKIYADELKDPAERLARQLTGVSLFTGFVYARGSQVEFDEEGKAVRMKTSFSDFQTGEKSDVLKTGRVAGPLAAHELLADLYVRWKYELPPPKFSTLGKDVLEVAGGLGNMGFDTGLTSDVTRAIETGSWGPLGKRLADVGATFTYPVTILRDVQGQLDPELSYSPYTRNLMLGNGVQKEYNLLEAMLTDTESLNRLVRFLPETELYQYTQSLDGKVSVPLYDPFSGQPVRSINPLLKQLTGIERKAPPTEIEKEINTLNLKSYRLYKNSTQRNAAMDLLVRYGLAKNLNKNFVEYVSKPLKDYEGQESGIMYSDLNSQQKTRVVEKFVSNQITLTSERARSYFDKLSKEKPKAAASYIRNQYFVTEKTEDKDKFDTAIASIAPEFKSADEYINASETVGEELRRRDEILNLVAMQP